MSAGTKPLAIAALARAMDHPLRVRVLDLLSRGPALVGEMVSDLEVEPTVLSKHLAVLRDAGLVECEAQWRCRRYRLPHPEAVRDVLTALAGAAASIDGAGGQR